MSSVTSGNPNMIEALPRLEIPAEGDAGLFTQSWFALCRAEDVPIGQARGFGFLDGRVVAFRGENGVLRVMSAYCPHLGADLSVGDVQGNEIRCAFHHWKFDQMGRCSSVAFGDKPPAKACVFNFPVCEKYGVVWVFNGVEPTWEIPDFPVPEEELDIRITWDNPIYPVDPWVICANTPDWQHLAVVHDVKFDADQIFDTIRWTENSMAYSFEGLLGAADDLPLKWNVSIHGTSMFMTHGMTGDMWSASLVAFGIPKPGYTQGFFINCVKKGDASDETKAKNAMALEFLYQRALDITYDDRPILHTARYRPGTMIRADRTLMKYMRMVQSYPRAHPSADFIR